jgi:hypothetical protein
MTPEDRLQDRLARLEAGESLEACLAGLPEEEAGLIGAAAAVRSVVAPRRAADRVAAQRAELRRAASERRAARSQVGWRSGLARIAALPRVPALAAAGAAIFALVAGVLILRQPAAAPSPAISGASAVPQATAAPYVVRLPIVHSAITAPDPRSAIVSQARGSVEVDAGDGRWAVAGVRRVLAAGQRIRTGELSSATLLFFDGSQARLGPETELVVDQLDARVDGPRVVQLAQSIGESDHDVAASRLASSRYEVRTPNGVGIARGTSFHVEVTPNRIARFSVDEGVVAVTNRGASVSVVAGQSTTIYVDEPPTQPVFRISGEGEVTQIGDVWTIGGRDFLVNTSVGPDNSTTEIIGDPQIGDWVRVDGRVLPDGSYFADRIVLLHRAPENRFAFTGRVESIGETEWTISGRPVSVNGDTDIEAGIETGDLVEARGLILRDGTLLAESIRLVESEAGLPFEFTGVVESIGDDTWTISGVEIAIGDHTDIKGDPGVGDIVKVEGHILADGTWLADEIKLAEEDERRFEFTGAVEQIDPWVVSGIHFDVSSRTEIDDGIAVGSRVKVEGRVLDDGIWLADEIKLLEDLQPRRFDFVGRVSRIDPWIIGGLDVAVDGDTEIDDGIEPGDMVRVKGVILPDGTLLARRIERVDGGLGCLDIAAVVVSFDGKRLALSTGQVIDLTGDVEVFGTLRVGSVVLVRLCADEDGEIVVVRIVVIYTPAPRPTPPPPPPSDGKVTICHIPPGNPSERHTITVGWSAWINEHRNHGDTLGPCSGGGDDDDHDD